jgi:hypothetical protein
MCPYAALNPESSAQLFVTISMGLGECGCVCVCVWSRDRVCLVAWLHVCAAVGIIVIPRLLFAVTTRNLSKAAALEEQVSVKSGQVWPIRLLSSCCPMHDLSCRQGMACGLQSAAPKAACTVNEEHSMGWVGVL